MPAAGSERPGRQRDTARGTGEVGNRCQAARIAAGTRPRDQNVRTTTPLAAIASPPVAVASA